jgi:predicted nuclease of predicted toxin-antitoxin system
VKFLIDAQLPPALARWLTAQGQTADHVVALGMGAASDAAIADYAERVDAIVVSKDEDFLFLRLPDRFALLWVRLGNCSTKALLAWLEPRWTEIVGLLGRGERVVELR